MKSRHYLALWEFQAKPDRIADFEQIYGSNGPWVQLFRQSPDYLGTELVRDLDHPGRYLTLDRWTSREALHKFKQDHQAAYSAQDQRCESLTDNEVLRGDFEIVSIP